jgi:hypothetical protein
MRDFIQILLLISFTETIAQDVTILDASNAYYLDGTELKNRNFLLTDQKVKIKKKGHLGIRYGHWRIHLRQGVYNMDSVIMAQRQIREYIIDDSVYSILKTKELHDCEDTRLNVQIPTNIWIRRIKTTAFQRLHLTRLYLSGRSFLTKMKGLSFIK